MASFFVVIFALLCCTSGNPFHGNREQTKVEDFAADFGDAGEEYTENENSVFPDMRIELYMEGEVNGHEFAVEGEGEGQPYEGWQTIRLQVTEGGPLPFAFDILTTAFQYGNRAFTSYPPDIPDFFKESFPAGHYWERTMRFEDGGVCDVTNDIRMAGDCFYYHITFNCHDFEPSGPIMMKQTEEWEPSCEAMYAVGKKDLQGDDFRHLLLKGGGHFRCDFRSTYHARKSVEMPKYHFVTHRIKIISHDVDYMNVVVREIAAANYSPMPQIEAE